MFNVNICKTSYCYHCKLLLTSLSSFVCLSVIIITKNYQ